MRFWTAATLLSVLAMPQAARAELLHARLHVKGMT